MSRETQEYKRSFSGSVGSGVKSIFGSSEKTYYILEHRIGSKYHHAGEQQEIIIDQVEIGRDAKCQVRFDEIFETVSRRHAAVIRENNQLKLIPLSKTNPTLLNGKQMQTEWFLQNGDEIQCAVNGPKLIVIFPHGKNAMTSSINIFRRLYLFGKQVFLPYKRKLIVLMCIILILILVGGYFIFIQ